MESSSSPTIIWWIRQDLRLADNPALCEGVKHQLPIIPVYFSDTAHPLGAAAKVWVHHSLASLQKSLEQLGSRLILTKGSATEELPKLAKVVNAGLVVANKRYDPEGRNEQEELSHKQGFELSIYEEGRLLFEPESLQTGSGTPYKVFTPYYRKSLPLLDGLKKTLIAPSKLTAPAHWPSSMDIDDLHYLPTIPWDKGIINAWKPGETEAHKLLEEFKSKLSRYETDRDIPSIDGTSFMSPYLCHGEITPRQIVEAVKEYRHQASFVREVIWREFSHHVLWHFPHTVDQPLKANFKALPWKGSQDKAARILLEKWQQGQTGYPLIDAGMRQLWETGWMHNRVRLAVGSFLVKHLLIGWEEGAAWFWNTLVDADVANNTMNWQWVGGCGADAQPFFRIFNPTTQFKKFDPDAVYVKHWVPELKSLSSRSIYEPWKASTDHPAQFTIGESYPEPIVDHDHARHEALQAFQKIR